MLVYLPDILQWPACSIAFNPFRCQTLEPKTDRLRQACDRLISGCAALKAGDRALAVSNPETRGLGELISNAARKVSSKICHLTIPAFTMHGQEPPKETGGAMLESDAIFAVTRYSMAHSKARLRASGPG